MKTPLGDDFAAKTIRIHDLCLKSRTNGPGLRAVIWVQGCTLDCPQCFNPATHQVDNGKLILVPDLAAQIMALSDWLERDHHQRRRTTATDRFPGLFSAANTAKH